MANMQSCVRGLNAYPVPQSFIDATSIARGLDLSSEATQETLRSKPYNLVRADVYMWLSEAPDISQGGQSFSFTDEQRARLRSEAKSLYAEFEPDGSVAQKPMYGYKGSRL